MMGESTTQYEYQAIIPSPLPGSPWLGVQVEGECIAALDYLWVEPEQLLPLSVSLGKLFEGYFNGDRVFPEQFVRPSGTSFQQTVWRCLLSIPVGEVVTYGELAWDLNTSPRAVAAACRANPIPILIPCHRVIAANGPGGYMGKTAGKALEIKQWLLQHEGYV